jgi:hypothetical protein
METAAEYIELFIGRGVYSIKGNNFPIDSISKCGIAYFFEQRSG